MLDRIALGLILLFSIQALLNYAQTYLSERGRGAGSGRTPPGAV